MIDIVLATYNGEKYIEEQISSIKNQKYENWRLIIRDDDSKDRTLEIIEEISKNDSRIILVKDNLGNLGFNDNFKKLLKYSDAPYVMISDQDDVWLPNKIEVMFNKINNYLISEKILVHCDAYVTNEKLYIIHNNFIGERGKRKGINSILMSNSVQGASIMMTKALKNSFLENIVQLPYDYNISLIAELIGKRIYVETPLMYYRQHQNNVIGVSSVEKNNPICFITKMRKKFSLNLIKTGLDKYTQLNTLKINLDKQLSNVNKKYLDDFLYLIDDRNSKIIKILKFYKNRYSTYRKIDQLLAPIVFLKKNRS